MQVERRHNEKKKEKKAENRTKRSQCGIMRMHIRYSTPPAGGGRDYFLRKESPELALSTFRNEVFIPLNSKIHGKQEKAELAQEQLFIAAVTTQVKTGTPLFQFIKRNDKQDCVMLFNTLQHSRRQIRVLLEA
ncbi:hypothetical protein Baya_7922 [Bagarius yarrelli]|uniref:Uncharacterized protein n=1 Tax=Bagarius yarrelli TaxID=175774 RepID=A0A556U2P8_BAGYA|nr:hypothetical protein Baya_7922 [Bagarius yarrelli]